MLYRGGTTENYALEIEVNPTYNEADQIWTSPDLEIRYADINRYC